MNSLCDVKSKRFRFTLHTVTEKTLYIQYLTNAKIKSIDLQLRIPTVHLEQSQEERLVRFYVE
jgi:hypothetical protein